VLVLLDASGSMNVRLPDGRTRLDAAKAAVADFLGGADPNTRLALRVYGHQSDPHRKDCRDSELVADFASALEGKAVLLRRIAGLSARGYTPITLSLRLAAEDIAKEPSAERIVVLVSDGRETCSADPCVAARTLAAADAKLVVHTIGFGVDASTRAQLQCIASMGRGSYFDANSGADLATLIGKATIAPRSAQHQIKLGVPKVAPMGVLVAPRMKDVALIYDAETDKAMTKVIGGPFRKQDLPVGIYSVKLINGAWTGIEIKDGEETLFNPAVLRVEGMSSDNVDLLDPETNEVVGYFNPLTTREAALLPGRFIPRTGRFDWPTLDLREGQTTVLVLSNIKVNDRSGTSLYKLAPIRGGPEVAFVSTRFLTVPPGKYLLWHADDAVHKIEIEVAHGQTLELNREP
jgi:hypothetical protein